MDLYSLLLIAALFLLAVILQSLGLWIASRMMRLDETGYPRAFIVSLLTTTFSALVSVSSVPVSADPLAVAVTAILAYVLPLVVYYLLIFFAYGTCVRDTVILVLITGILRFVLSLPLAALVYAFYGSNPFPVFYYSSSDGSSYTPVAKERAEMRLVSSYYYSAGKYVALYEYAGNGSASIDNVSVIEASGACTEARANETKLEPGDRFKIIARCPAKACRRTNTRSEQG